MLSHPFPLRLFNGGANAPLATAMARDLEVELAAGEVTRFGDGETSVEIRADVRGCTVVIVQPTCPPVNDHLMALALLADAARVSGAARVLALVPYFGYARQERRTCPGQPRSARVAAQLLGDAGIDHLVTIDLHAPALESALPMPATLLDADTVFLPLVKKWGTRDCVVVAPDGGAVRRAQRLAVDLHAPIAVVIKNRGDPDAADPQHVLGNVRGKSCLLVDDLVSSGTTLANAAEALKRAGAAAVNAVFTHAVLSHGTMERLLTAPIARFATTDTVWPLPSHPRIDVVSAAPLLAETVRSLMRGVGD